MEDKTITELIERIQRARTAYHKRWREANAKGEPMTDEQRRYEHTVDDLYNASYALITHVGMIWPEAYHAGDWVGVHISTGEDYDDCSLSIEGTFIGDNAHTHKAQVLCEFEYSALSALAIPLSGNGERDT